MSKKNNTVNNEIKNDNVKEKKEGDAVENRNGDFSCCADRRVLHMGIYGEHE